jgi:phosphoserine phosphatase
MKLFSASALLVAGHLFSSCKSAPDSDVAFSNPAPGQGKVSQISEPGYGEGDPELDFDSETDEMISRIIALKDQMSATYGGARHDFGMFLDFDGTIISGDITDGGSAETQREGNAPYPGLSKIAFDNGIWNKTVFPDSFGGNGKKAFEAYWNKFTDMANQNGHQVAYEWSASLFANLNPQDQKKLDKVSAQHFIDILNPMLFKSSVKYIKKLNDAGVKVFIVSASPTTFVDGARVFFNSVIPKEQAAGINMKTNGSGRIDAITNYAEGKIARIEKFAKDYKLRNKVPLEILAGFGNSWSTDGAFLRWVAHEKKGIAVMINGGKIPDQGEATLKVDRVQEKELVGEGIQEIDQVQF